MVYGHIERANRSFRQDVLDADSFANPIEMEQAKESFDEDYTYQLPNQSLDSLSPLNLRIKHIP